MPVLVPRLSLLKTHRSPKHNREVCMEYKGLYGNYKMRFNPFNEWVIYQIGS